MFRHGRKFGQSDLRDRGVPDSRRCIPSVPRHGRGFLEAVYQECLAIEFAAREIPFDASKALTLRYGENILKQCYVADFVCFGKIIIELKAVRAIAPEHRAQIINYLRATDMKLGLLVNFGATPGVEIERFAL